MAQTSQLLLPSPVVVGGGVSQSLPEHARRLGLERVLVVTDDYLLESGPVTGLVEALEATGISTSVYSGTQPDPTVANVGEAIEVLRAHEAEGVVVIGGGSPIDNSLLSGASSSSGARFDQGLLRLLEQPPLPSAPPHSDGRSPRIRRPPPKGLPSCA